MRQLGLLFLLPLLPNILLAQDRITKPVTSDQLTLYFTDRASGNQPVNPATISGGQINMEAFKEDQGTSGTNLLNNTTPAYLSGLTDVYFTGFAASPAFVCDVSILSVTTTAESGPGSLRQAMLDIATTSCPGPFTISVTVSGTISLTSALTSITKDITFVGSGANNITVRRTSGTFRLFDITSSTATVSFDGFTIADGSVSDIGAGIRNAGKLTVSNCVFRNNQSTGTGTGRGGGIANTNQLIVRNTLFDSNSATTNGGGIYNSGGSSTIVNCSLTGNQTAFGGGIFNNSGHTATLSNCVLQSNSAVSDGGGIYNNTGSSTIISCSITGNQATNGGGILNTNSHTAVLSNCVLQGNSATTNGGGISNGGGSSTIISCSITGNNATNGGGILNTNSHTAVLSNCVLHGNSAITNGGGIYNSGGSGTLSGCLLTNNQANNGGAIFTISNHIAILTNCTLKNNSAATNGGGLYNNAGSSTIVSCSLTSNQAIGGSGGAILNVNNHSATISTCVLNNNSASVNGGSLYNDGGNSTVVSCSLTDSQAGYGGAIFNSSGHRATLSNIMLQKNLATNSGGGFYITGSSNLTLVNGSIEANQATSQGGGAYTSSSTLIITNASFRSNTATNGTGLYLDGGTAKFTNGVMFGNGMAGNTIGNGTLQATYSLFEAGTTGFSADPTNLTTIVSPFSSATGTGLATCSPAIDRGNNGSFTAATAGLPFSLTTDLAGNARFFNNGTVDMGAYEFSGDGLVSFSVLGSGTATCMYSPTITLAGSETGVSYQLQLNGTAVGGSVPGTGSAISFGTQPQSGTYTVLATRTGNSCTLTMATMAMVVSDTAVPNLTVNPEGGTLTCAQPTLTLTANTSTTALRWSTGQTTATISVTAAGTYSVTATGANGCSAVSNNLSITENFALPPFTVSSATVCPGQSVNLTASGCTGQIRWSTGASTAMITLTAGSSTSTLTATCTLGSCSTTAGGQVVVGGIQPPPAQILSFSADESACPVKLIGKGMATSFTMTGPKGYVFSTVFREGGSRDAFGLNVKLAGTYTLTATYTNSCGTSAPVTRTVTVGRSCP